MFQEMMDGESVGAEGFQVEKKTPGSPSSTGVVPVPVEVGGSGGNKGTGPRRLMTSFQMDADVAQVLAQVEEDGRLKSRFINEACRRLGRLRGYRVTGRKKRVARAGQ